MNSDTELGIPRTRRIKVIDINPHLMCVLCGGYYVDATTIIECLHSFCKSCIVRYLDTSKFCPICDVQIHKTKPLLNIRSDQTLQDIVYKLVPGLFQREMKQRREFYAKLPPEALKHSLPKSNEERGEVDYAFPNNTFSPDEFISIALEYSAYGGISNGHEPNEMSTKAKTVCRRYLRCPMVITVAHIKKLIRAKYGLSSEQRVDLMFSRDCLNDDFMIMDIAYMYAWKRKGPLKLYYRIFNQPHKRLKTCHSQESSLATCPAPKVDTITETARVQSPKEITQNAELSQTAGDELDRKPMETLQERPSRDDHEKDNASSSINGISKTESLPANGKVKSNSVNDGDLVINEIANAVGEEGKVLRKEGDLRPLDTVAVEMETNKVEAIKMTECKLSVDRVNDGACDIKKSSDFNLNIEKMNGIKSDCKDGIFDSKEIKST